MTVSLRLATADDAAAVRAIYAPIVERTPISFELTVPDEQEVGARIARTLERAPWLMAEEGSDCLGFAYAVAFRARPAYQWSIESSVYVDGLQRRRGVARALYQALLEILRLQRFCRLVAGITLPNDASVALHEGLGFSPVGVFERIGFKHGRWHAVGFWDLQLQEPCADPPPPRALDVVAREAAFAAALEGAAATIT